MSKSLITFVSAGALCRLDGSLCAVVAASNAQIRTQVPASSAIGQRRNKAASRLIAKKAAASSRESVQFQICMDLGLEAENAPWSGLRYIPVDAQERAKGGNPIEKLKIEKDGLAVKYEVDKLAEIGYDAAVEQFGDDVNHRLKWIGVFTRPKRTPGRFMMRLKISNGILTSDQMRFLAEVIAKYPADVGVADITTRQNIQLRGLLLEDLPWILHGLRAVGLSSVQAGMDNVRNFVGSPIAGIDPKEMVDTRPVCQELQDMITHFGEGNPEFTNLPRKFNISVSGGRDDFAHTDINDIGYRPAEKDGVMGFNVVVGGFMGSFRVVHSVPLDAWVPLAEATPLARAILTLFRDRGSRKNRNKARMMYMVDELGVEGFREQVEEYFGKPLCRAVDSNHNQPWERRSLLGVHDQKQEGLHWVGCHVPVGRLHPADMLDLARVADAYSAGEIRLTVDQNVIFPNVSTEDVVKILGENLLNTKFLPNPTPLVSELVSCTGAQFCGFALVETKNRSLQIAQELDAELFLDRPVRIHWTGCSNSCGQPQLADIGVMGVAGAKKDGKRVEGVSLFLDGEVGENARLGTALKEAVPADDVKQVLKDLLVSKFGAKPRV
eukprot:CAMPEP_0196651456 /NCGR_PEP_ID=MMETSP1086-20130531/401_1 /TAXON_ID=77921 /ORGANISM="Cyanoptyche  gloeocystis , Strain SAG4.97" /LENGTH=608 /DNA_ID=CAMNT_0041981457 /DNA_START=32 /DNA_END=1858 /DNA_ORIENTATION=+